MTTYAPVFRRWRPVLIILLIVIIAIFGIHNLRTMIANVNTPPVWDFQLFWIFGRASAHGLNPYDQANLIQEAQPLGTLNQMISELYFFHLPPTLFLFAPLGWFEDVHTAYLVWYVFHTAILIVDILLLWRLFLDSDKFSLLFCAAFVLSFFPTRSNIVVGQLNFLMMFFLLLFWAEREKPRSGLWLALGIITKPIMAFVLLYVVLRGQWKSLAIGLLSLIALSAGTILVYGPEMFFDYFLSNPVAEKMPNYLYVEIGNQSLLGVVLRAGNFDFQTGSPILYLPYLIPTILLTAVTAWFVYRLDGAKDELALSLVVVLALIIYPKALWHYSFILLTPLLFVWHERKQFPGGNWGAGVFIALNFIIVYIDKGSFTFAAFVMLWAAFAVLAIQHLKQPRKKAAPA